jgi:nucleotide-binding universal stress UspA family protein
MMKTVLVAVDGSDHAEKALKFAAGLAGSLDAVLLLVTVDEPGPLKGEVAEFAETEDLSRQDIAEWILNSARMMAESAGANTIETDTASGEPAEAILRAAGEHKADMIVLGARGLSDLRGLIMGSVSHKVLSLTSLPCLIVRE